MNKVIVELTNQNLEFLATDEDGNEFKIAGAVAKGGTGNGFPPMKSILAGLAGCSGMDVVSIMKKKKQVYDSFIIEIDAERKKEATFSMWSKVYMKFKFTGNTDPTAAKRSVELSITKYCSVAETLRRAGAEIFTTVFINGVEV